jgi:hypothetical protein
MELVTGCQVVHIVLEFCNAFCLKEVLQAYAQIKVIQGHAEHTFSSLGTLKCTTRTYIRRVTLNNS